MGEVEMVIDSVRQSQVNLQWVVILKEKLAERYLSIYIGSSQADTIKRELTDVKPSVPIANDPISKDIKTIGSRVSSVKIDNFKDNKFSAKLVLAASGKSHKVDYLVAKALAIAVRAEVPVFADEAILNKAGISVPA